jgi:hypothetical protein
VTATLGGMITVASSTVDEINLMTVTGVQASDVLSVEFGGFAEGPMVGQVAVELPGPQIGATATEQRRAARVVWVRRPIRPNS